MSSRIRLMTMLLLATGMLAVCLLHIAKPGWPHSVAMWPLKMRLTGAAGLLATQSFIVKVVAARTTLLSVAFGFAGLVTYVFIEGGAFALTWELSRVRGVPYPFWAYPWIGAMNLLFSIPAIALFTAMLITMLGANRYFGSRDLR